MPYETISKPKKKKKPAPRMNVRAVGNVGDGSPGGMEIDPRSGVSGNSKSRNLYPGAQGTDFCMRKNPDKKRKFKGCAHPRRCKKCLNYSEFEEKK